jgi:hypothetical protein
VTWTPPNPNQPTGPARLSWRLAHSSWLLAPILSFGCLSAAGFLYVGIRARRPDWWIPGVAYSVIASVCFFLGGTLRPDSIGQNISYLILFPLWLVSIIHAVIINASWLRWRATHQPWYAQPQPTAWAGPSGPAPMTTPLPPQVQGVVPAPEQFYAAPTTAPAVAPAPPVPLDVNTAGERDLAALPGFGPARAAHVLAVRQSRGGFTNLTEFAAAAALAPHEFVAVRDRLSCTPLPSAPATDQAQPYGRIVDV